MRRIRLSHVSIGAVLTVLIVTGLLLVGYGTASEVAAVPPELRLASTSVPEVTAGSALVVDVETGSVVYEKDADAQRPIASITKLVSSAMFYEHAPQNATATVSWSDVAEEGRAGRLQAGQEYQNHELLFPALLESSNDGATTMRRVAPTDLVADMNAYAQEQQLHSTVFTDTSGLDAGNLSTARELSTLGISLHEQYPHIFDITQLRQYLNDVNGWLNNNPFVDEEGYQGGKHGYTYEANRTAIALFVETLPSGEVRQFSYVLLGSEDLRSDMAVLRDFVQKNVDFR